MKSKKLIDPDLLALSSAFPSMTFSQEVLPIIREKVLELAVQSNPEASGVEKKEIFVPSRSNDPDVRCLLYQPKNRPVSAAYLQIHGGGFMIDRAEAGEVRNIELASTLGVTVLAVDYRLAPENPYPAALDDCYSALLWLVENADELNISTNRIAVGGDSAGGGLAASLCLQARDGEGPEIAFQSLIYPMLDDRTSAPGATPNPWAGEIVWTPENNRFAWSSYIGEADPNECVPARATTLAGLPPTWIATGALDLFAEENLEYARRLLRGGVATELHVYPGVFHGFDLAAEAAVVKRFKNDHAMALARGLGITL